MGKMRFGKRTCFLSFQTVVARLFLENNWQKIAETAKVSRKLV